MRPILYIKRRGSRLTEVDDLDHAIRLAESPDDAGRTWWLVAGSYPAEATIQLGQLRAGNHPNQININYLHAEIRAGLRPDLGPLTSDDPCPHLSALTNNCSP
ncbi:hypothetical protein ACYOEI_30755 [Singulisphaera rosea]